MLEIELYSTRLRLHSCMRRRRHFLVNLTARTSFSSDAEVLCRTSSQCATRVVETSRTSGKHDHWRNHARYTRRSSALMVYYKSWPPFSQLYTIGTAARRARQSSRACHFWGHLSAENQRISSLHSRLSLAGHVWYPKRGRTNVSARMIPLTGLLISRR